MKTRNHQSKARSRKKEARSNPQILSFVQNSIKDTVAKRERHFSLVQEAHLPLIDLYKSRYEQHPSALRSLETRMARERRPAPKRSVSGGPGGRPVPSYHGWGTWPPPFPPPVIMVIPPTMSSVPPEDENGGGSHQYFPSYPPLDGKPGTLGGTFTLEGAGSVDDTQLEGYSFRSPDAGPTEAIVMFNPQGYIEMSDPFGLAFVSCSAQILVQDMTTDPEVPVLALDTRTYATYNFFPTGVLDRTDTNDWYYLSAVFNRRPNIDYIIWVQVAFSLAGIPVLGTGPSILVQQEVSMGSMTLWLMK